ncbi:MAG: NAD(P)/FAD-dependent oxidoreductase [Atopostipes suicloacalis]|nr:NAD(P)/FAD-dependent oxidoreductase [Atopostipes suicloacalis]
MHETSGVVIVGGSIAGYSLARQLRKNNYNKKITLIDGKNTLPYDRSKLSTTWMKDLDRIEPPLFQKRDFYIKEDIKVLLNTKVNKIDPENKVLELDSKEVIPYDKLVLATGSKLKKLEVEDSDAGGIFYLRDHEDAVEMKEWSKNIKDLVIIGGGFIGLELASSFSQVGLNVTVVEYEDYPMAQQLGVEVSKYFIKMHKEHGVHFLTGKAAKTFKKDQMGNLEKVITTEGKEIPAQMAVIAIGVEANHSVNLPGLAVDKGVIINEYGETNIKDVYAIGDLVSWPYQGKNIRTAHWEHAYYQGKNVAKNIIKEKSQPYEICPYFWTDQYDQTFERLGYVEAWDRMIIRGSLESKKFTVAYLDKDNRLQAIFFANNGDKRKEVSQFMDREETIIDEDAFKNMTIPLNEMPRK